MQPLTKILIENIKKKGKITFAEFMRTALYHPQYGYYNSQREQTGKYGDYYTSPTVHSIFGELLAQQMDEMWRIMGKGIFTIVEMGANKGWLCHDIIRCITQRYTELYNNFHYIIVETNPFAMKAQKSLLSRLDVPEDKVSWHTYTQNGFSFGNIQGCFLSNEFVDAMPVHRVRVKNGTLKEVYVCYNGIDFFEKEGEISTDELQRYLNTLPVRMEEGQEAGINLCAAEWFRHVAERLQKGFVLTIDYGDMFKQSLCDGIVSKPVRCFYRHTVNYEYYQRLGEQDMTAHVDFTYLIRTGKLLGLEFTGFTRQSHYLLAMGILEKLKDAEIDTILKAKNLFHPEGMGDIFKVLIQHKGVEHPNLKGFMPIQSIAV